MWIRERLIKRTVINCQKVENNYAK